MAEPATPTTKTPALDDLFGLYAVIGGLLVALAVVVWSWADTGRAARLLAREGQEVTARVIDLRRVETRRVDNEGRSYTEVDHYARVGFDTSDQCCVTAETEVTGSRFDALEKGMTVQIRYAASDPQVIEFQAGETAGEAAFLRWAAILLAAITVVLSAFTWRRRTTLLATAAAKGPQS